MRTFPAACLAVLLLASGPGMALAQSGIDSDADGLSDALEQRLLEQFQPAFQIGRDDCSHLPAEFRPEMAMPAVQADDGTIYGQVFPAKESTSAHPVAEVHFYHLWPKDCGPHGHRLDTEHVAVLVEASGSDPETAKWKAQYWYAAAHEQTVCDVSQIARAKTLHAEDHGAKVWISPGKHASYLNETLCQHGCGADRCVEMVALPMGRIINLGEADHPANGIRFVPSAEWPLEYKMTHTNFPDAAVARLEQLPENDIAWFNPGPHPAQGVISAGVQTGGALESSGSNTASAISVAQDSTGNALQKSYHRTRGALAGSAAHVGRALHITSKEDGKN